MTSAPPERAPRTRMLWRRASRSISAQIPCPRASISDGDRPATTPPAVGCLPQRKRGRARGSFYRGHRFRRRHRGTARLWARWAVGYHWTAAGKGGGDPEPFAAHLADAYAALLTGRSKGHTTRPSSSFSSTTKSPGGAGAPSRKASRRRLGAGLPAALRRHRLRARGARAIALTCPANAREPGRAAYTLRSAMLASTWGRASATSPARAPASGS